MPQTICTDKVLKAFGASLLLPLVLCRKKESGKIILKFCDDLFVSNDFQAKYTRLIAKAKTFDNIEKAQQWAVDNGYFIDCKN